MPHDLFISYSRQDNAEGRITQLVERIKTDFTPFAHRDLVPFFDQQEIHGMQDWRQRILQGLRESRLPPDDALALIESYQPDGRFRSEAERGAAREIVRLLGCFTLAVESAAVYLGQFANDVTCAAFLARLKKKGLEGLDTAASQSSEAFAEIESTWQNRPCKLNPIQQSKRKARHATRYIY